MSTSTIAKLKGDVSPKEITDYLAEKGIFVGDYRADVKMQILDGYHHEAFTEVYYRKDRRWIQNIGYITGVVNVDGNKRYENIFYLKSSINTFENLEYFSKISKHLEEMVKSETTHVSCSKNEFSQSILKCLAEHFGGWYFPDDCKDDEFLYFDGDGFSKPTRIDIMTDIETLGKGDCPPVFQIAACAFDIKTGEIYGEFNSTADISGYKNIEGDTLIWWLNTNKELLSKLLNNGKTSKKTEKDIVSEFVCWIKEIAKEFNVDIKDVYLWGNGILFDNRIIKQKCGQYGIEYPIFYRNDRDVRTILELGAFKKGFKTAIDFTNTIEFEGSKHDAFDDVKHQIKEVVVAYNELL